MSFKLENEFQNHSITATVITYKLADFKKINLKNEIRKWVNSLDNDSETYPTYTNSQFQKNNLKTKPIKLEDISDKYIYVVPHYYENARFSIEEGVTKEHVVWLTPILSELLESKPMSCIVDKHADEELTFWKIDSFEPTTKKINFFQGKNLKLSCEIDLIDNDILSKILSQ